MRKSGILMHITSLPGPYGIGTMGKYAYDFIDFLSKSGQTYWQILPLNPTGFGDSPYQAFSSHAGNPYLIDLDMLIADGLLENADLDDVFWGDNPLRVDFGAMYEHRYEILRKAFGRFTPEKEYSDFVVENSSWLNDYAAFAALKAKTGKTWLEWPRQLMLHDCEALAKACSELEDEISFQRFMQYIFFKQWRALHKYAGERGVRIIGDVPIYVPLDSAEVWANPELFELDENRRPIEVAGCPPDGFSADGQLWGNPLYNWGKMRKQGFKWWLDRLSAASHMYDVIRIDHFRGFESFWAVPYGDTDAKRGRWKKGPGEDFISAVKGAFSSLDCIAEDLGFMTAEVKALQQFSGYPGMKVIEFAFDPREDGNYLPHLYPKNSVCYTGTHDNATLSQWLAEASEQDLAHARAYLGLNNEEGYAWGMLRGGMSSVSRIFIAQMQDYLGLGAEARMNRPGILSPDNWTWRASEGYISDALAEKIHSMTALYGRI